MLRCVSEYQLASLKPKVIGSAWMPWVRPIMRRVLELPGAALQHFGESLQVVGDDRRGLLDQQGLRGIDHVVRGQAVVEPARRAGRRFRRPRW